MLALVRFPSSFDWTWLTSSFCRRARALAVSLCVRVCAMWFDRPDHCIFFCSPLHGYELVAVVVFTTYPIPQLRSAFSLHSAAARSSDILYLLLPFLGRARAPALADSPIRQVAAIVESHPSCFLSFNCRAVRRMPWANDGSFNKYFSSPLRIWKHVADISSRKKTKPKRCTWLLCCDSLFHIYPTTVSVAIGGYAFSVHYPIVLACVPWKMCTCLVQGAVRTGKRLRFSKVIGEKLRKHTFPYGPWASIKRNSYMLIIN